ncbi:MAG: biotin transporter BioY [Lachnospiraceae bacterium]|nr:biotin transporter BioY [Lachnospiraceae bacterium]
MSNVSATTNTPPTKQGFSTRQLAVIGVMTAVTCILAPLSLPIGPVPISLTNLAIYFSLYALGVKFGCVSYLAYLLIGFIGVPVFSGFTGGPSKLLGPTGGYLIGFIPMALIAGLFIDKFISNRILCLLGMIAGTAAAYALGTAWLAYQANLDWKAALMAGVIPFLPGDLAKMILAIIAGPQIRRQLIRADLYAKS